MFQDREEAGNKLKEELRKYKDKKDTLVLAVPRGGVVLGKIIADYLALPLDILVVRKIGYPQNPEFAVGAINQAGEIIKNPETEISYDYLKEEGLKQQKEIIRRLKEYRGEKKELKIENKNVIIVDDGIATGLTTQSAINFVKLKGAKKIILAVPVIASNTAERIKKEVDELVYLLSPEVFFAVGQFYSYFPQVTDSQVKKILNQKNK